MNSTADELNIKSRLVRIRKCESSAASKTGESEHSVMLPLEIEEGTEKKETA